MQHKKILFINTDEDLLKTYAARGYETEVLSSYRLMGAVSGTFVPDVIFVASLAEAQISEIRKEKTLAKVPVIILAESFKELNNLNPVADFPFVAICNRSLAEHKDFMDHIEALCLENTKLLAASSGKSVMYAILYMNKNLGRILKRDTIASQVGLNSDYLTRIFKKQMGISLWDYLTELRLSLAKKLLSETGESCLSIAKKCGFADDAYFCNVFKSRYGCPPGEFRSRL